MFAYLCLSLSAYLYEPVSVATFNTERWSSCDTVTAGHLPGPSCGQAFLLAWRLLARPLVLLQQNQCQALFWYEYEVIFSGPELGEAPYKLHNKNHGNQILIRLEL